MFAAIGRWFAALGYLLTGKIDAARRVLDTDPHVVRARYDDVIRDKTERIQQYKQAVAQLIAQKEKKVAKVRSLTEEVEKLERLKAGALAKAKQRVKALQESGTASEAIQADAEYQKCQAAYADFSSTLAEKQARIAELEGDIQDCGKRVEEHKVQLQHLVREIETVKAEAADAVADFITANQEKEIADALSGIAEDGTGQELEHLRSLRHEVKAEATVSKELAGTDARAQEAEFLDYARAGVAGSEFDALVGLSEASAPAAADGEAPESETAKPDARDSALPE